MKALVTGASGFIGSHLVDLLLQKGYSVRCLLRRTSSMSWLKGLPIEIVYGDVFDDAGLADAVRDVDVIYHSAGLTKAKTKEEYYQGQRRGNPEASGGGAASCSGAQTVCPHQQSDRCGSELLEDSRSPRTPSPTPSPHTAFPSGRRRKFAWNSQPISLSRSRVRPRCTDRGTRTSLSFSRR